MAEPSVGRQLRGFLATLAGICFLAAGIAYAVTWYRQSELEKAATRDARKLAVEVLQPLLTPADVAAPIEGERYDTLQRAVTQRMLGGPIDGVRVLASDGTILFADDEDLVGEREPELRPDIHAAIAGTAESVVVGERFRTITTLKIGEPPAVVAVELGRSHTAIVEEAQDPWYPWVQRGIVAGAVCVGLAIATWLLFSFIGGLRKATAHRRDTVEWPPKRSRREPDRPIDPDSPAYMLPGFQEEVQARRRVEEELEQTRRERDSLRNRVRRLEMELDEARGEPSEEARLRRVALEHDELERAGAEPSV
jgi:hypothetical protein